ncbi:MAG: galactofuranose transport system permease protein [Actinoplanes sp.]|nr:galactofuranose transport system permease protein [Actinoplanes sp.]
MTQGTDTEGVVAGDTPALPAIVEQDIRKAERTDRIVGTIQRQGALAVLAVVVIVASVSFPNFRSFDNAGTILIAAAPPMLIALGMTFVIITGGIDLSVGSLYVLGGVVSAWASQYGFLAALVAPLVLCGLIGVANGLLIAYTRMAPFIVTLAALLGARGLMRAISSEGSDTYLMKSDAVKSFGTGTLLGIGYPVWLVAVLVVLGVILLARTRFGHAVYAVGGSQDAASLMGIAVRRTQVTVYIMSGLLAGLAGAINAAKLGSGVTVLGSGMELDAISAVVIGGTLLTGGAGTVAGTIAGVLLLGVIQNMINQIGNVQSNWQQVISGAFLALVVVAQTYLARLRRVN